MRTEIFKRSAILVFLVVTLSLLFLPGLRFPHMCTSFSLVVSSLAHKQKGAQTVCAELTACGNETTYYQHLRTPPLTWPRLLPSPPSKDRHPLLLQTTSVFCLFLNLIQQEPQDAFFLPSFLWCYTDECQQRVSEVHPRPVMMTDTLSTPLLMDTWISRFPVLAPSITLPLTYFPMSFDAHSHTLCRYVPFEDRTAEPQGLCIHSLRRSCPTRVHVEVSSIICFLL